MYLLSSFLFLPHAQEEVEDEDEELFEACRLNLGMAIAATAAMFMDSNVLYIDMPAVGQEFNMSLDEGLRDVVVNEAILIAVEEDEIEEEEEEEEIE